MEKLPSGRARAVYRTDDGGRRSKTFAKEKDAKTFLAATVTDLARGQWVDPRGGQMPFRNWVQRWQEARVVRPTSREADSGRLRNHLLPYFGDRALKDITPLVVRGWVASSLQDRSVKTGLLPAPGRRARAPRPRRR